MIQNLQSSPFFNAIGWTILHSVWQIILVGILLWIVLYFISKKSPKLSYVFSLSALILICLMTTVTFFNHFDFKNTIVKSNNFEELQNLECTTIDLNPIVTESTFIEKTTPGNTENSSWQLESFFPFFVLAWMLGVLFFGIKFTMSWKHIYFLKKTKTPLPSFKWQIQIDQFCQKMNIDKKVNLFLSDKITSPITFGHFKPIILFPTSMLTGLTPDQIEMLLLHELAHIHRADFLINLIQSIIEVILFYHPIVWWISEQIRISREHCCDDMAIEICQNHFLYAETLTQLQTSIFSQKKSLAMSVKRNSGTFTYRIQRLFQTVESKPSFIKSIFSFGLIAFCLTMFAFQNPMIGKEKHISNPNEGMLFVLTNENAEEQIEKIKNALNQQNVKFEYESDFDKNHKRVKKLEGKIIMPDNSFVRFNLEKLEFMLISLDWTRRFPLSILINSSSSNLGTEVGDNGALSVKFKKYAGFHPAGCILDDITVGRYNNSQQAHLFLNDLNGRSPIFILDGKKISGEELEAMKIDVALISSIVRLNRNVAESQYPNEDIQDGVYHISTRLKKKTSKTNKNDPGSFYFMSHEGSMIVEHVDLGEEGSKTILQKGGAKSKGFTYHQPIGEDKSQLFFINGEEIIISQEEDFSFKVKDSEQLDSIVVLTGKITVDNYGEAGKDGVWLVYTSISNDEIDVPDSDFFDKKNNANDKNEISERDFLEKSLQIHPNPIVDNACISYELREPKKVHIQVFDQKGNRVSTVANEVSLMTPQKNKQYIELKYWYPENVSAGIYFIKIQIGDEIFTRKVIKVDP